MTRAFLDAVGMKYGWIDCAETISSALLFHRIITSLRRLQGVEEKWDVVRMGADVNAFIGECQKVMEKLEGKIVIVPILHFSKLCFRVIGDDADVGRSSIKLIIYLNLLPTHSSRS